MVETPGRQGFVGCKQIDHIHQERVEFPAVLP
jgi:hypothetical protein